MCSRALRERRGAQLAEAVAEVEAARAPRPCRRGGRGCASPRPALPCPPPARTSRARSSRCRGRSSPAPRRGSRSARRRARRGCRPRAGPRCRAPAGGTSSPGCRRPTSSCGCRERRPRPGGGRRAPARRCRRPTTSGGGAGRGRPIHAMAATRTPARPQHDRHPEAGLSRRFPSKPRPRASGRAPQRDLEDLPQPDEGQEPAEASGDQERGGARGPQHTQSSRATSRAPRRSRARRPPGGLLEPGQGPLRRLPRVEALEQASGSRPGARGRCAPRTRAQVRREPVYASHRPAAAPFASASWGSAGHDRPARGPQEEEHHPRHQQVEAQACHRVPRASRQQDAGEGRGARRRGPGCRPATATAATRPRAGRPRDPPGPGRGRPGHPARATGTFSARAGFAVREGAPQEHADVGHRDDHGPAPFGEEAGVGGARRGPHQGLEGARRTRRRGRWRRSGAETPSGRAPA